MPYTADDLKKKLASMYPELAREGIDIELSFDADRDSWVVRFVKGDHSRYAFLAAKDADECMEGRQCLYLGVLIEQYAKDLEEEVGIGSAGR